MIDIKRIAAWFDCLNLPEKYILPLFTLQWGCGTVSKPDYANLNGSVGHGKHDASLYYNGIVFIRVMLPFFVGVHLRWSGSTTKKAFLQTHVGWKKNGVLALTFRIQSDESAAAGTYGHNWGQAQGWSCGCH